MKDETDATAEPSSAATDHGDSGVHHHHHGPVETTPHQHAFFVVGTEQLFLVHMGNMWMAPHRYQMVLEIAVPEDQKRRIIEARAKAPGWYIIGNDEAHKRTIPELALAVGRSFIGGLWREFPPKPWPEHWPWANEPPIVGNIPVTITRVVYFRALDFNMNYPTTADYFLFGAGSEAHLCHLFTRQPDYDHVMTLERAPEWLPETYLRAGAFLNFPDVPALPPGGPVYTSDPIGLGERAVQLGGLDPKLPITIATNVFCDTFPINEPKPDELRALFGVVR